MLEGEINQINLVERLVELWRERFTGAIRFESEGIIKILYFKTGDILSASTNDRADSIDEILMRAGKVSREHVKQALAKRKESETLGDALLNLGFITRKELTWARRVQVVGVIRSIAAWTEGSFTVVADYLPKRDEGTQFPVPQVLVELIVTDQDRAKFERELDGGNVVFAKSGEFDEVWRNLGLNEEAEAIAKEIDGQKTANEIATASGGETFNVYKLLFALALLRVLTRGAKPQVTPEFSLDDFAAAGVADAADLWAQPIAQKPPVTIESTSFELDQPVDDMITPSEPELDFSTPDADLDFADQPLSGMNLGEVEEPEPEPVTDPGLSWTSGAAAAEEMFAEPESPEEVPVAPARLPAWDAPPRQPLAVPIPSSFEPPAEAEEELGGFDEAQLETARRAAVPAAAAIPPQRGDRKPPVRTQPRSRRGLMIAILAIAIIAAAGYFGTRWWQAQQEAASVPVAAASTAPAASATGSGGGELSTAPDDTGTIVPVAPEPTSTVATSSVAPQPATIVPPATTTSAAAPAVVTPQPQPAVPATGGSARARLDEMARQYASNPRGNYTVQIQILCDPSNLEKAMRAGGDSLWFVPQPIGERSCYRVFWGRFETREQAQQALAQVPASLRDRSAAVKPVPGR